MFCHRNPPQVPQKRPICLIIWCFLVFVVIWRVLEYRNCSWPYLLKKPYLIKYVIFRQIWAYLGLFGPTHFFWGPLEWCFLDFDKVEFWPYRVLAGYLVNTLIAKTPSVHCQDTLSLLRNVEFAEKRWVCWLLSFKNFEFAEQALLFAEQGSVCRASFSLLSQLQFAERASVCWANFS